MTVPSAAPVDRLIRLPELLKLFGIKTTTCYDWIRRGLLPPGIRLGPRMVAWRLTAEIELLVALRVRGASDDEIRRTVSDLIVLREVA